MTADNKIRLNLMPSKISAAAAMSYNSGNYYAIRVKFSLKLDLISIYLHINGF